MHEPHDLQTTKTIMLGFRPQPGLAELQAKPTDAKFTLKDPSEVMAFLTRLVQWGNTHDNAWHAKQSCTGWALKASGPSTSNTDAAASAHTAAGSIADEVSTSYSNIPANRTHSSQHNQQQHSDNDAAADSMHMTDAAAGTSGRLHSQTGSHNSAQGHQPASSNTSPFGEPSTSEARTSTSHASVPHATGSGYSRDTQTPSGMSGAPLGYADFRREGTGSADVHDARRASLDHYLSPEDSSSRAWQPEPDLASSRQQGFPGDSSKGSAHQQLSDKNGERLTALLLDKLHGHAAQSADHEDVGSPPAVTSNDSGSMAGYRSPFESLASYGVPEDAESIHAEHGSAASLRVMPSVE